MLECSIHAILEHGFIDLTKKHDFANLTKNRLYVTEILVFET